MTKKSQLCLCLDIFLSSLYFYTYVADISWLLDESIPVWELQEIFKIL